MIKNRIKALRSELGITQLAFAQDLKVTRQTVIAIENGKYNPSLELSLKISRYFHRTVEEIFELVEEGPQ